MFAVLRAVLCVIFPVGVLWSAVSHERRSLQDLVVRSIVVYEWRRCPADGTDSKFAASHSARPPHPARGMPISVEERTVPSAEGVATSAPQARRTR